MQHSQRNVPPASSPTPCSPAQEVPSARYSKGSTTVIELRQVTKRFLTPGGQSYTALRDLSLAVAPGEFCALIGPTGCGKSTTLSLIAGLDTPSAGTVLVMGEEVHGTDPRIGYVFQTDAVFPWKNVLSNVAAGPLFRGLPKREALERAAPGLLVSVWPVSRTAIRTSSRAVCASVWPLPRPSSMSRRFC